MKLDLEDVLIFQSMTNGSVFYTLFFNSCGIVIYKKNVQGMIDFIYNRCVDMCYIPLAQSMCIIYNASESAGVVTSVQKLFIVFICCISSLKSFE